MNRLPIRVRLTLAFALAMGAVLAGMALLIYIRVGGALLASVDQTLHSQATEAQVHHERDRQLVDPDVAGGTTLAEIVDPTGRVLRATPTTLPRLIAAADAARAVSGRNVLTSVKLRTPSGDWRVLAAPIPGTAVGDRARPVARAARDDT